MAIQTRNSALAVKVESTEGTPVAPTASTDYVALQDDAAMSAESEVLTNNELKSSLGPSKTIVGVENPTFTTSHYLRHSGTEGQAPNYGEFLKAAFGSEIVEGTEYDTVAASTTTAIKVDAGEGVQFERGQAVLVKDGTNGYSIRAIDSVSTDDLIPAFALQNAPGTGVNLGKSVTYAPTNSGHQTLSIWHYVGNSGAIQMMAGARVTETTMTIEAGQLINANYSLEGLEYYFNPIEIEATDTYLDFTDDGGTFAAQITAKMYKHPHDLAAAIQTAMNSVQTAETHSVTYSDTDGKFTVSTSTSSVLSLLWSTGANTANTVGDKIGFTVSSDDTGATSYESDNAYSDLTAPQTPSYDSADPLVAKSNLALIGDQDDNTCFQASSVSLTIGTPKTNIDSICADSGRSGSIINAREVSLSVTALLTQYDADKFRRFNENTQTRFMYVGGSKTGGNWDAGKCFCLYLPTATISSYNLADADGLVTLELELTAYVNEDGDGEVYLSFV